jgi:hypothetical protein
VIQSFFAVAEQLLVRPKDRSESRRARHLFDLGGRKRPPETMRP